MSPARACRLDLLKVGLGQLQTSAGRSGPHYMGVFWQTYIPQDPAYAGAKVLPDADRIDVSGGILIVEFHCEFSFN